MDKMTTIFDELLGREKIKEVCDRLGLDSEDKKIVEEILTRWEELKLTSEVERKVMVAINVAKNYPQQGKIMDAVIRLNALLMGIPDSRLERKTFTAV